MAENETIADGAELAWREKAMWLLLRRLGGEVVISDQEWASVPERPELIIGREGETRWGKTEYLMRWTAREPEAAAPVAAEPDGPEMAGQLALPGTEPGP